MLTLCYEVAMRYLFNSPTIWVLEVNQYMLCAYVALTGGYIMRHNSHVNIEIFYEKFSPRRKAWVNLMSSVCFFTVTIVLLWKSGIMAWESWMSQEQSFSILPAPLWPSKLAIPIGAFLILIQGLAKLTREVAYLITGQKPAHL